ncbi:polymeric immunoglobulin receptor-like [Colossoma macropomum]|uniref:polymeric immunoglobulin receptor-like n=1 Tax=Colossoma macropomum TaxID=42526 RepID=UPI001864D87E|nr:polymeric immunoglobulin receptor-like [Colossoma macropomum]
MHLLTMGVAEKHYHYSLSLPLSLSLSLHVGVRCETEELNYTAYKVRIRCPYKPGYKEKYFCKGDAKIPFEAGQSRKFLLHDNTSAHIFTLNITHLELEDKGTYWCVRRGNSSSDIYRTKIHLDIKPELTCELGQNVSIQCHYNQELRNSVKFLCKEQNSSDCAEGGVKITSANPQTDRVSLSDDASAGVFTVTIAGLKQEDSGTYWCGGSTGLEHVLISSVDLNIFRDAKSSHNLSRPTKPKNQSATVVLTLPSPSTPKSESDRGSSAEVKDGDNTRLSPPAADYDEIKDSKDRPDTHSKASTAELLTDPSGSPTDQTDGHDYAIVTFQPNPSCTDQTDSLDYSTLTFQPNSSDYEVHASGEMCTYSTVNHPQSE